MAKEFASGDLIVSVKTRSENDELMMDLEKMISSSSLRRTVPLWMNPMKWGKTRNNHRERRTV